MARTASRPGKTFDRTPPDWAGDAVRSLVFRRPLERLSWKHSLFRPAWWRSARWATRPLLAIVLAAAFRKPWPIVAGIFVATIVNHAAAGAVGGWVAQALGPDVLRWVIGVSFLAMAGWMLIPDKIDEENAGGKQRFGVFGTTVVAFFLAEMGDKTQIATVALAARYPEVVQVVLGTTFGMMLANVPAVFLGDKIAQKVSMKLVHSIAAVIFAILGVLTLFNVGKLF